MFKLQLLRWIKMMIMVSYMQEEDDELDFALKQDNYGKKCVFLFLNADTYEYKVMAAFCPLNTRNLCNMN